MDTNQPVNILAAAAGNVGAVVPGQKRDFTMVGGQVGDKTKRKRPKKPKVSQGPILPKNALMQLNEIKPGLMYNIGDHEGPVHNPVFRCTVEVNGQVFEGQGVSKKKAKLDAAEKALASFVQLPTATGTPATDSNTGDYMTDQGEGSQFQNFDESKKDTNGSSLPNVPMGGIPVEKPALNKNPVMILNELKPGTQYSFVSETGEHHTKSFTMEVMVNERKFQGEGRSKKLAKARAAQLALKECFNIEFETQPDNPDAMPLYHGSDDTWMRHKQPSVPQPNQDPSERNSVQQLNELYSQIQFICDEPTGNLLNTRLFRVSVTVEGQTYEGMANNKKTAKMAAANAALEGLKVSGLLHVRRAEMEANRKLRDEKQKEVIKRLKENGMLKKTAGFGFGGGGGGGHAPDRNYGGGLDPCSKLSDLFPNVHYKFVGQLGEMQDAVFTVQCVVNGIAYMGSARNKRDGRYSAAEKALRSLGLWSEEDEEMKRYREMHDGKNPPVQARPKQRREGQGQSGQQSYQQKKQQGQQGQQNYGFKKPNQGQNKWGGPQHKKGGDGNLARAGFNRVGGGGGGQGNKGFKSVLSNQWTQFKKGGTLGSGMVFGDRVGSNNQSGKKITGGTQSLAQQAPQSVQQDFTQDTFNFDPPTPSHTPVGGGYSYGYGGEQQQPQQPQQQPPPPPPQTNPTDSYYTSGYASSYQNPSYGYGYDQYSTGASQYAQQF